MNCFYVILALLLMNCFYVLLALFWNFKAQFASNGSKVWKNLFYKSVLEFFLYTYIPVNHLHFLKNMAIAVL